MKSIIKVFLFLTPCFFMAMKCIKDTDECHHSLFFENTTDKGVYAAISYDYPDTSLNFQNPKYNKYAYYAPHARSALGNTGSCVEDEMRRFSASGKMSIFVFDAEVIDNTPWVQVRQNYQVLKRYDFTVDDLRDMNFYLYFP